MVTLLQSDIPVWARQTAQHPNFVEYQQWCRTLSSQKKEKSCGQASSHPMRCLSGSDEDVLEQKDGARTWFPFYGNFWQSKIQFHCKLIKIISKAEVYKLCHQPFFILKFPFQNEFWIFIYYFSSKTAVTPVMHYFECTVNMTYKNHAIFRKWTRLINTQYSSAFRNEGYTCVAQSSATQNIDIQLQLEEWSANKFHVSCLHSNKTVQEMSIQVAWPSKVMNTQQLPEKWLYLRIHLN